MALGTPCMFKVSKKKSKIHIITHDKVKPYRDPFRLVEQSPAVFDNPRPPDTVYIYTGNRVIHHY